MNSLRHRVYALLRASERYTKTDMVYLARSGFWINLSSILITLFSLVLYVAFAHFLPKETYGTYQYLLSIAAIVSTFTLSGMNAAVSRAVAQGNEGSYRASIRLQLSFALIPAVGALIAALYYAVQGNAVLALGLVVIAVSTPFVNAFNTYSAYLVGKKDFYRVFLYNFAINVPYYGGLIAIALFVPSAIALLLCNVLVNAIGLYVAHRQVLRTYNPPNKADAATFAYGKHLSAMGTFAALVNQLDSVLVFHYLGATQLAVYAFATAIPDRITGFFRFFSITSLPKFSQRSDAEIRKTLGIRLAGLLLISAVVALAYFVVAPYIFQFLFPQYVESVPYSALYALSMASIVGTVALTALTAQERTRDLYIYNIVTPTLQIVLQIGGIIFFGLWGLVIAKTISTVIAAAFATTLILYGRSSGNAVGVLE